MNHAMQLEHRPRGRAAIPQRPPAPAAVAVPVVTVFLVDPHELVHLGLAALLGPVTDLRLVGAAAGADTAVRAVVEGWADVVLIDVGIDGDGGRQLARDLSASPTRARYCFLVDGTDPAAAVELTRLGVSGLLHRRASGRHLIEALRRCTTETLVMDPVMADLLMSTLLGPKRPVTEEPLTERDLELLRLLGEGRTNREIADAVYLSEKTVKNYLSRLFRKLGVRSRTEAALLSARYGHAPTGHPTVDPCA